MTTNNKLNLDNIYKRIENLPLLPSVLNDLMLLDLNSNHCMERLKDISRHDPSLAARILRIANSAHASPIKPITDIQQAVVRTGSDDTLAFLTKLHVVKVFTPVTDDERYLWRHSIEAAYFAEYIAQANPKLNIDPKLAYTCGLLHDIGRFVLFDIASKAFDFISSKEWINPKELSDTESHFLGFDHAEVGNLAAERWHLPKDITLAIKLHHNYSQLNPNEFPEHFVDLLHVIQLSDFISIFLGNKTNWQMLKQHRLLDEIKSNCISKINKCPTINTIDLIKNIPLIVDKVNDRMKQLHLA
ncbi:MAG: HDOD domain-containing protein [Oceanospirillaceae bacterium]